VVVFAKYCQSLDLGWIASLRFASARQPEATGVQLWSDMQFCSAPSLRAASEGRGRMAEAGGRAGG
jgi:hypothetical protein